MRIERAGEVQFNALGEPTRQIDAAGRVIQRNYDAAGRPVSVADGHGYRQVIERDTEGRTMRIGLYRPESGADPYRATYYRRDAAGRPIGQLLPDGRLLSWAYDADGQATEQIDGNEVRHLFLRRESIGGGMTSTRLDQAPDGAVRLSGGSTSATPALVDDFGQVLRVALPDHGARRAEYDAAGRIVRIVLDDGGRIYAIHTDQRGAPIALTDARKTIVWRANVSPWGIATPADGKSFGPAILNLRLPGQYYDEETGLHDNGFRTYDPASGNYLQPDPLGYPDGPDPYRYAGGDPLNRTDPDGLYAIDVHYYMTYFLALTAGLDDKTAWVVATAAQTIDDVNPYTDALPHLDPWDADSALARERYHFTQTSTAWDPLNP